MQAAGTAGACAGGQLPADQRVGPGGKRGHLFMAHMHPVDVAAMDGIGDVIEGVADDPVTVAHTGRLQGFNDNFGNALAHDRTSTVPGEAAA